VNVDLLILGVVSAFALWGAFSGVAKQITSLVSIAVGYLLARPLAGWLGPPLAKALRLPQVLGIVLATLVGFIVLVIAVRRLGTPFLRRLLAGSNPEDRGLDRFLGLLFGGLKAAFLSYLMLCCLTFVEDNVVVAGKRLGLTPRGSRLFALARQYNLITLTHFTGLDDLVAIANAAADPRKLGRLERSDAYQALRKDPRFRAALSEPSLRRAFEHGDASTLLRNNAVLDLLRDAHLTESIERAANASRTAP
jgi:membrane protein required for colicin V production